MMQTPLDGFEQFSRVAGLPGCRGSIKHLPEDFSVDEVLGFEPTGSGEHLLLRIRKRDRSTPEVARILADLAHTRPSEVGYSGMKDRRSVSTQWFSIPVARAGVLQDSNLAEVGLEVLESGANARKLRIGVHRANNFRILLRHLAGDTDNLQARVATVSTEGVPNYFGPQRLGQQLSNVIQARDYFRSSGEQKAVPAPGRRRRQGMLYSAARAFLFNRILSRRVTDGTWDRLLAGEVLALNGTRRFFKPAFDTGVIAEEELSKRLDELDIHPTGWLAGHDEEKDPYRATDHVAELEAETVAGHPELVQGLVRAGVRSARRALRLVPVNLTLEFLDDETALLTFTLAAGGYATAVMRELADYSSR